MGLCHACWSHFLFLREMDVIHAMELPVYQEALKIIVACWFICKDFGCSSEKPGKSEFRAESWPWSYKVAVEWPGRIRFSDFGSPGCKPKCWIIAPACSVYDVFMWEWGQVIPNIGRVSSCQWSPVLPWEHVSLAFEGEWLCEGTFLCWYGSMPSVLIFLQTQLKPHDCYLYQVTMAIPPDRNKLCFGYKDGTPNSAQCASCAASLVKARGDTSG